MKQISDYVEIMFKELPQTEEVLAMKRNILDSMEEKYHELIESGLKESQAVGQVIGEFGSIDEIKEALDIELDVKEVYDSSFVEEYLMFVPQFANRIATGVAMIIGGLAIVSMLDKTNLEPFGTVVLFGLVAVAVALFVTNGMRLNQFEFSSEKELIPSDKLIVEERLKRSQGTLGTSIALGIGIILFGLAVEYLLGEYYPNSFADGSFFLVCVMIAVYIFITSGVQSSLPKNFNPSNHLTREQLEKDDRWGEITGAVMGLVAMLYVGLGLWNGYYFGILWIMFPVAALLLALLRAIFRK